MDPPQRELFQLRDVILQKILAPIFMNHEVNSHLFSDGLEIPDDSASVNRGKSDTS